MPDVLTFAKGLASGLPIGAVVATPTITATITTGDLGSTFGGGPVPCAAALATLEVIEREGLVDNAIRIEAARLLTWKSGALLDQGERNTLASSHAKRFAADTAMEVTVDAVQVYGGYGFIKEYPVEKLMRDAKIMQLYEGTSQIQRLVIARETLIPRRIEAPVVERQLAAAA